MCKQAVNFLRYACVPVGVVEGRAPDEKLERLQQRYFDYMLSLFVCV